MILNIILQKNPWIHMIPCECCGTMDDVWSCHILVKNENNFISSKPNPFSFECKSCALKNWNVVNIVHSILEVETINKFKEDKLMMCPICGSKNGCDESETVEVVLCVECKGD